LEKHEIDEVNNAFRKQYEKLTQYV
jgi:hypothetical protein